MDMPSTPVPVLLAGRYEVTGLLGVGGMGSVYRALDRELDEVVALKVLRRELLAQPGMLDRFRREVKLARRVTHTNVARVFDIGEHDGDKFITMELVDGEPLSTRLNREFSSTETSIAIAMGIGEALDAAHAAGVIHRDLKPDNVMIARDGRVIVTDFGIARATVVRADASRTLGGMIVGTPQYMAPEQVEGTVVDERADIYAYGLVLYEMLTGRPAWDGHFALAVAMARLVERPPDPRVVRPSVSAPLAELVLRMLSRAPTGRPGSAREVVRALAALSPQGSTRPSVAPPRALQPRLQRVMVVPFASAADDVDRATAFGIAELIADGLDGRPGIDVCARGVRVAAHANRTLARVGSELDIPLVIGGRIEGEAASITLVNARDGLTLWSRTFPSGARDAFSAACDAVNDIARVLLVPPAAPPAAPPADAKTAALILRARFEIAAATSESEDRAVAFLEQAFARSPTDPWVNAAYSLALARRLADIEFPGDADEALAMALKAVERAPRMAATHQALAEVLICRGDRVAAARSIASARALAPSNPDVERIAAHLYVEAGALGVGVSLLRSASQRDGASWRAVWDEARTLAAQGQSIEAEGRVDAAGDANPLAGAPWLGRVRGALFRGDLGRCDALRRQLGEVSAQDKEPILAALDAVLGRAPVTTMLETIEGYARAPSCSRQRSEELHKLATDVAGLADETAKAASLLTSLAEGGLVDLPWLDGSVTLARLRPTGPFMRAHDLASGRARQILASLEQPQQKEDRR